MFDYRVNSTLTESTSEMKEKYKALLLLHTSVMNVSMSVTVGNHKNKNKNMKAMFISATYVRKVLCKKALMHMGKRCMM